MLHAGFAAVSDVLLRIQVPALAVNRDEWMLWYWLYPWYANRSTPYFTGWRDTELVALTFLLGTFGIAYALWPSAVRGQDRDDYRPEQGSAGHAGLRNAPKVVALLAVLASIHVLVTGYVALPTFLYFRRLVPPVLYDVARLMAGPAVFGCIALPILKGSRTAAKAAFALMTTIIVLLLVDWRNGTIVHAIVGIVALCCLLHLWGLLYPRYALSSFVIPRDFSRLPPLHERAPAAQIPTSSIIPNQRPRLRAGSGPIPGQRLLAVLLAVFSVAYALHASLTLQTISLFWGTDWAFMGPELTRWGLGTVVLGGACWAVAKAKPWGAMFALVANALAIALLVLSRPEFFPRSVFAETVLGLFAIMCAVQALALMYRRSSGSADGALRIQPVAPLSFAAASGVDDADPVITTRPADQDWHSWLRASLAGSAAPRPQVNSGFRWLVWFTTIVGFPLAMGLLKGSIDETRLGLAFAAVAVAFLVLAPLNIYLHRVEARTRAPSADELLRSDARRPILYLRPFDFDGQMERVYMTRSSEEILTAELYVIGPVIAVGRPSEQLPPIGAARFYVPDGAWRQKIADAVSVAEFVVWTTGTSEGLRWELAHILSALPPEKLIVWAHPQLMRGTPKRREEEWCRFLNSLGKLFPKPFPQRLDGSHFFLFGPGHVPRSVVSEFKTKAWRRSTDNERAVLNLLIALGRLDHGAFNKRRWLKIGGAGAIVLIIVASILISAGLFYLLLTVR